MLYDREPFPQRLQTRQLARFEFACVNEVGSRSKDAPDACGRERVGAYSAPLLNRFSTSAQFTTFQNAAMYSGRRFWYFR
jgi:hypothetical protein